MLNRILLFSVILLSAVSAQISAQLYKVDFSFKRNYGLPLGKSGESYWARTKTGYGGGLNLNFFLNRHYSIGFDVAYLEFSGIKNSDHLRVSKEIFTYSVMINYYLRNERFTPYFSAGGGLSNATFVYRIIDKDNSFDVLDHINVPLFSAGLGLNIPFSERTYFILESRFVNIFSKDSRLSIAHYKDRLHFNTRYLSLFGGLCYEMGRK